MAEGGHKLTDLLRGRVLSLRHNTRPVLTAWVGCGEVDIWIPRYGSGVHGLESIDQAETVHPRWSICCLLLCNTCRGWPKVSGSFALARAFGGARLLAAACPLRPNRRLDYEKKVPDQRQLQPSAPPHNSLLPTDSQRRLTSLGCDHVCCTASQPESRVQGESSQARFRTAGRLTGLFTEAGRGSSGQHQRR